MPHIEKAGNFFNYYQKAYRISLMVKRRFRIKSKAEMFVRTEQVVIVQTREFERSPTSVMDNASDFYKVKSEDSEFESRVGFKGVKMAPLPL